jgi:hypothetical protein
MTTAAAAATADWCRIRNALQFACSSIASPRPAEIVNRIIATQLYACVLITSHERLDECDNRHQSVKCQMTVIKTTEKKSNEIGHQQLKNRLLRKRKKEKGVVTET